MGKLEKILDQILRGGSDQNVAFDDLTYLLVSLGFEKRIKGSHHLFSKDVLKKSSIFSLREARLSRIRLSKLDASLWNINWQENEHVPV